MGKQNPARHYLKINIVITRYIYKQAGPYTLYNVRVYIYTYCILWGTFLPRYFASKLYILQRTVSRDFEHFYFLKTFINFTFHNADTVMAYSHRLHGVSKVVDYTWSGVCVVVDYTLTQCL